MDKAILLDFGSTYTKAAVADLKRREIVFTTKAPSTVWQPVMIRFALKSVKRNLKTQQSWLPAALQADCVWPS